MSSKSRSTSGDSIGRPGPWQEGRYQPADEPLDNSVAPDQPLDSKNPVNPPADANVHPGPVSTPVHLDEYTGVDPAAADAAAVRKPR